jgi:hypothetical protein
MAMKYTDEFRRDAVRIALTSGLVIPPFVGLFETRTTRPSGTGSVSWRV